MHFVNIFTRRLPESGASGPPAAQAALARPLVLGCFAVFLLLSGCGGTEPECDSLDTRNSVVKIVSDDNNNALVNYAAKNSSSVAAMVDDKSEAEKSAIWEKARQAAVYRLDDTILMNSRRGRDFQRQDDLNPARCQRTMVSGFTIASASQMFGNNR
jgi:hypothetical protein